MNYSTLKDRIKGPCYSIVTPFKKNDAIDFQALDLIIQDIYDGGGRIFYVMGYNSRFSELSWAEIKILNEYVTAKVKSIDDNNIMIVADPLHCPTKISVEFAQHAEAIGADLISIICREKYYSDDQIFAHFKLVADNAKIGILIHEMPFISGHGGHTVNYSIELLDRICSIESVVALKEDSKDDILTAEIIKKLTSKVAIVLSGGGKRQWLKNRQYGCESWLNGIGVFHPKLAARFWDFIQEGNSQKLNFIIDNIETPFFTEVVDKYGWHLSIKAAMQWRELLDRYERLPMLALPEHDYNRICKVLDNLPIAEAIA